MQAAVGHALCTPLITRNTIIVVHSALLAAKYEYSRVKRLNILPSRTEVMLILCRLFPWACGNGVNISLVVFNTTARTAFHYDNLHFRPSSTRLLALHIFSQKNHVRFFLPKENRKNNWCHSESIVQTQSDKMNMPCCKTRNNGRGVLDLNRWDCPVQRTHGIAVRKATGWFMYIYNIHSVIWAFFSPAAKGSFLCDRLRGKERRRG